MATKVSRWDKTYSPDKVKESIKLDVSRMAINKPEDLVAMWEFFVSVTDELPDVLVMNSSQYNWYKDRLIDLSMRGGWPIKDKMLKEPTFRGLPIQINDKRFTSN